MCPGWLHADTGGPLKEYPMNLLASISRTVAGAACLALACGFAQAEPQSLAKDPAATGDVTITSGNSARIVNDLLPGGLSEYGLVITRSNLIRLSKDKLTSRPLSHVRFSFDSSGTVAGGAPRFSIPIDTNGDGNWDGFAFLDVNNCGSTFVSTESSTCKVFYTTEVHDNWAAFAAAHPTYRVLGFPFVIADQPGDYFIYNIDVK
jgi:hypothetical protein